MINPSVFDIIRIGICIIFFSYASISDWKKREVSNKVWILFLPIGAVVTLIDAIFNGTAFTWTMTGLSILVTSIMAIALFYLGAFGGADAKALICLSVTIPIHPLNLENSPEYLIPFPITVFVNSVLLAALGAPYMLLHNLLQRLKSGRKLFEGLENEPTGRKILALLCGYKVSYRELIKNEFLYPLEDIEEDGEPKRKLIVFPKDEERENIVKRIVDYAGKADNLEVWVTPGLPMLIFITLGFIIALFVGNIVLFILRLLLGL